MACMSSISSHRPVEHSSPSSSIAATPTSDRLSRRPSRVYAHVSVFSDGLAGDISAVCDPPISSMSSAAVSMRTQRFLDTDRGTIKSAISRSILLEYQMVLVGPLLHGSDQFASAVQLHLPPRVSTQHLRLGCWIPSRARTL